MRLFRQTGSSTDTRGRRGRGKARRKRGRSFPRPGAPAALRRTRRATRWTRRRLWGRLRRIDDCAGWTWGWWRGGRQGMRRGVAASSLDRGPEVDASPARRQLRCSRMSFRRYTFRSHSDRWSQTTTTTTDQTSRLSLLGWRCYRYRTPDVGDVSWGDRLWWADVLMWHPHNALGNIVCTPVAWPYAIFRYATPGVRRLRKFADIHS